MSAKNLSAVVITFNEGRNIERCLRSLLSVADEIIVLDSMSTDDTVRKASMIEKVQVVSQPWLGYSASKNAANKMAKGSHILSVDADEVLDERLQKAILAWKDSQGQPGILEVNRLTNYCGRWIRHSGWYPEYKIRVFPKDGSEWQGTLHETLQLPSSEVKRIDGNLLHYSYPTVESHLRKIMVYAGLAVEKDIAAGKKYSLLVHGILKPWFVFVKKYFLQAGFLDGYYGFVIAVNSAYERFLRYTIYRQKTTS